MPGNYDGTGIEISGGGEPFPKGVYHLRIVEAVGGIIKSGDNQGCPKVTVDFRVVGGIHAGRQIRFHTIAFLPKERDGVPVKGAGMSLHFLKCIGEPYEGKFIWNESRWIDKVIKAFVVIEEDRNGKRWNKVSQVMMPDPDYIKSSIVESVTEDGGVPF